MATENIASGKKYRILVDAINDIWDRISFWTKASDVEFDDGTNLEDAKQSFGKGMLQRNTVYHEGDIAYTNSAPSWVQLRCTNTGTTAVVEPTATYAAIDTQGMAVIDGTATFEVNDVRVATSLSNSLNQPASVGLVNQHVARLDAKMGDLNWYIEHGWLPKIPETEIPSRLEDCTWQQISELAAGDLLKDYFEIGESKMLRLSTGEYLEMQIADFNHDNKRGTVDFISKEVLRNGYPYNSLAWEDSKIVNDLNGSIWSSLPDSLTPYIIEKPIKIVSGGSLLLTDVSNKLWLPTAYEITGEKTGYQSPNEPIYHQKYPLFTKLNDNRVKTLRETHSATSWWTMSRDVSNNYWLFINTNNAVVQGNNGTAYNIPLCFRLGYSSKQSETAG